MKSKNFIKDVFVYGLNSFFIKVLAFIMLPIIVRLFSVEEFGVVEVMLSVVGFLSVFFGLGYDMAMKKNMMIDSDSNKKEDHVVTNFLFLLLWGGLLFLVLFLFRKILPNLIFNSSKFTKVFLYGVLSCYLNALISLFLNLARIEFKRKLFLRMNLFRVLLQYITIILALFFCGAYAHNYFLSIVFIDLIYLTVLILLNLKLFRGKFKKDIMKSIFTFGFPAMLSGLGYWIFNMSDKVIISNMTGSTYLVGIYGMVIKMLSIYTFIMASFKTAWIPRAFQMYNQDKKGFKDLLEKVHIYALAIFSTIAIFNFAGLRLMITVFGTKEYLVGLNIAFPLILAYILYPLTSIASIGIYISNKMKKLTSIVWVAALINIIVNIVFINRVGLIAVSFSTLLAYLYIYIAYWKVSCKSLKWKFNWPKITVNMLLIVLTILIINFININNILYDLFLKLFISIIYVLSLLVFKIIDINQIFKIFKNLARENNKEVSK